MKMRAMKKVGTMQLPGHYRPPQLSMPGAYNRPRIGRVGKQVPMPRARPLNTLPTPTGFKKPQRPKPRFPTASTRRNY